MAEGHNLVHDIENDGVLHETIVVDFGQVLHFSDSALVVFEVVLLHTGRNGFDDVVDDFDDKIRAIPI